MAMLETMSIIGTIMVLMLLLLIIILFVCKPWRFLPRSRSSPFSTFMVGDLQRPLVSHDENLIQGQSSEVSREFDLEEACFQNEGLLRSSLTEGRGVLQTKASFFFLFSPSHPRQSLSASLFPIQSAFLSLSIGSLKFMKVKALIYK